MAEIKEHHVSAFFLPAQNKIILHGAGKGLGDLALNMDAVQYLCVRKKITDVYKIGMYAVDKDHAPTAQPERLDASLPGYWKFRMVIFIVPVSSSAQCPDGVIEDGEGGLTVTITSDGSSVPPLQNIPITILP